LDLAPEERFKEVTTYFKEPMIAMIEIDMQFFPESLVELFGTLAPLLKEKQYDHYMEIQGIAEVLE